MEIQSAFNAGVQGFQKATEDANKAAVAIASETTFRDEAVTQGRETTETRQATTSAEPTNLNEEIVNLKVAEQQAKASAKVIESADENLGTLLDVRV